MADIKDYDGLINPLAAHSNVYCGDACRNHQDIKRYGQPKGQRTYPEHPTHWRISLLNLDKISVGHDSSRVLMLAWRLGRRQTNHALPLNYHDQLFYCNWQDLELKVDAQTEIKYKLKGNDTTTCSTTASIYLAESKIVALFLQKVMHKSTHRLSHMKLQTNAPKAVSIQQYDCKRTHMYQHDIKLTIIIHFGDRFVVHMSN